MKEFETQYGKLKGESIKAYMDGLVGRIFKLLPLREENNKTLNKYHDSLMAELVGVCGLIDDLTSNSDFIMLLGSLKGIMDIEDLAMYRSEVFKCMSICKKISASIETKK